jgi:hypothetical protein
MLAFSNLIYHYKTVLQPFSNIYEGKALQPIHSWLQPPAVAHCVPRRFCAPDPSVIIPLENDFTDIREFFLLKVHSVRFHNGIAQAYGAVHVAGCCGIAWVLQDQLQTSSASPVGDASILR